jgi:hypothetical protein
MARYQGSKNQIGFLLHSLFKWIDYLSQEMGCPPIHIPQQGEHSGFAPFHLTTWLPIVFKIP